MTKYKGDKLEIVAIIKKPKPKKKRTPLNVSGIDETMRNSLEAIAKECGYKGNISAMIRGLAKGEIRVTRLDISSENDRVSQLEETLIQLSMTNKKLWEMLEANINSQKNEE